MSYREDYLCPKCFPKVSFACGQLCSKHIPSKEVRIVQDGSGQQWKEYLKRGKVTKRIKL